MIKVKAKVFHIRVGDGGGLMGEELERQLNEWLASLDQGADFQMLNTQQSLHFDEVIPGKSVESGFIVYTVFYEILEKEE